MIETNIKQLNAYMKPISNNNIWFQRKIIVIGRRF